MSLIDQMRADMTWFLSQWGEPLLRRRIAVSYGDDGQGTDTWSSSLSFTGDFQPLSGKEIEAEAGLEQHSEHKVQMVYDEDVDQNDRVERGGETHRVNRISDYEEHRVAFVYREVNQ